MGQSPREIQRGGICISFRRSGRGNERTSAAGWHCGAATCISRFLGVQTLAWPKIILPLAVRHIPRRLLGLPVTSPSDVRVKDPRYSCMVVPTNRMSFTTTTTSFLPPFLFLFNLISQGGASFCPRIPVWLWHAT